MGIYEVNMFWNRNKGHELKKKWLTLSPRYLASVCVPYFGHFSTIEWVLGLLISSLSIFSPERKSANLKPTKYSDLLFIHYT